MRNFSMAQAGGSHLGRSGYMVDVQNLINRLLHEFTIWWDEWVNIVMEQDDAVHSPSCLMLLAPLPIVNLWHSCNIFWTHDTSVKLPGMSWHSFHTQQQLLLKKVLWWAEIKSLIESPWGTIPTVISPFWISCCGSLQVLLPPTVSHMSLCLPCLCCHIHC
jgi:hypothetical protein